MARGKAIQFEEKLKKAEEAMENAKRKYDAAVEEVNRLLKYRDEKRKEELFEAAMNSEKTYEEIMDYIRSSSALEKSENE